MLSLEQIETDLKEAMKAKDQTAVDVLRGLKTRFQNEKISKMRDLTEEDLLALVRSEVKRRKEAAASYNTGGRQELEENELKQAEVLGKYLPQQMSEEELSVLIEKTLAEGSFTAKDFGAVMGKIKGIVGGNADGALLAKLLKEKLK